LVSPALLQRIVARSRGGTRAVFVVPGRRVGFPLLLPVVALADVRSQIARQAWSIHELATLLAAHQLRVAQGSRELCNVNAPEDVLVAEKWLRDQAGEK
jgi:CTP:molybdopterin cytidylyltransferase MocA